MPEMQGHYGPNDLQWLIEHNGLVLAELEDGGVSWDFDTQIEPAGSGLGNLKNSYFKTTGAPKGTFKLSRGYLANADNGNLFLNLVQGSKYIIQEAVASSSATYTVGLTSALVSILEIRLTTANVVLREYVDYTVNYTTGVITFVQSTPETGVIRYLANTRKARNLLINGGFEDTLGSLWALLTGATIARNSANAYVEGYALAVTPVAANDGVQYTGTIPLIPGRTYRFGGRGKAAAAETLVATWYDGASDVAMTVVSGTTLTTTYTRLEYTFVATKASTSLIKIKDTKASPAVFYIDEMFLVDDTDNGTSGNGVNPMDSGNAVPFQFNLLGRRKLDGVIVNRLQSCTIDKLGYKSGKMYQESISGMFLDYIGETA